ncbi:MAG: ATP-dependent zinc metalloprotease FtsH [Bacteroidales bacterium]|nr:ATP-dependent zinc metalloprotease FtsH [Bacteroidales bacterium]
MAENKQKPQQNKMPGSSNPGPRGGGNGDKKSRFNSMLVPILIGVAILSIVLVSSGKSAIEIPRKELQKYLTEKQVDRIVIINQSYAEIYIKTDFLDQPEHSRVLDRGLDRFAKSGPHYQYNFPSLEKFVEDLESLQEEAGIPDNEWVDATAKEKKDIFGDIIGWVFPIAILVVIWIIIFRRMSGGAGGGGGAGNIFNVGKSRAKIFDKDTSVKIDFKDVAGLAEAKVEVMEIVEFLKKPKKYTELGGKIPKGALLVGPPGTGKTLLAKAVAGEANVPFFSMSGSDFVEMFVGVGASRVRDLFKQAKEKAPCIVFIDEIDAIGRARGKNANFGANDERENTLNQLLTEMDGFASNSGVIILAATNRADILDRALLRAGRFDRQIHVELPDMKEREEIFKVHLKPLKLEKTLNIEFLAKQTPGFSGADIANVSNEAALIAARQNKKSVQKQDFLDAIDRIIGGLEKKNKIITQHEKRTIAYHEAGHATVSWLLEHASPLLKVTIIPRGKALGAAWYLPDERQITTREQLLDEMCSTLGGRASEELIFGRISTGALNDLEKITKQAYAMVSYFGLSDKIGNKSFFDSTGQSEYNFTKPYSEKTAELIDNEVSKLIDEQYKRAIAILKKSQKGLTRLAELLLEKEVIFSEDLEKIFGKRISNPEDMPMVEAAMEEKEMEKAKPAPKKTTSRKKQKPEEKGQEEN